MGASKQRDKIAVVGATSWGLTMASVLNDQFQVDVLVRTEDEARKLNNSHQSPLLPDITLPTSIRYSADAREVLRDVRIVFIAVPSFTLRDNLNRLKSLITSDMFIVSCTKGMEEESGLFMSTVISGELQNTTPPHQIGVLSGPNLALEIAMEKVAFSTIAFPKIEIATELQRMMNSERFRLYTTNDIIGVEVGGAYKNVIALVAGFLDALDVGNNSKSALLTRGLHEMTRFGVSLGARPETFSGLSGLGDLLATCYSKLSRNYRFGWEICNGSTVEEAQANIKQVVEGITTSRAIMERNKKIKLDLPIAETVYRVIYDSENALEIGQQWLKRAPKQEHTL